MEGSDNGMSFETEGTKKKSVIYSVNTREEWYVSFAADNPKDIERSQPKKFIQL